MEKNEIPQSSSGFKKALDEIKPYLWLISLLPLILGGLIQVGNLMWIGISYLRFFSTTQLLQDGVLVLILLGLVLIPGAYYYFANREGGTSQKTANWFYYILVLCATGLFFITYLVEGNINYILLFVILLVILFLILKLLYRYKLVSRTIFNGSLNVLSLISFLIGFFLMVDFTNNIDSSSTLGNLENIKCLIKSEPYPVDSFKILYFNDKYIFTEVTTDKKSQIRIFPFEEMFNSTACKDQVTEGL